MSDFQKVKHLIQEAPSLQALLACMVRCLDGLSAAEADALMHELRGKLHTLKRTDKDLHGLDQQSRHSDRLETLGKMAAVIGHELRNPLSGIKVAAEYLLRRVDDQPELPEIIRTIHREVVFANTIIANILQHAKISQPCFERASITQAIHEAVLSAAQQGCFSHTVIQRDIPDALPLLWMDSQQIRQVLMNILINAGEVMVGGGTLRISAAQEGAEVVIRISDSGPGIAKECLESIFEPFFTTKVKGIGLGLAITREIIHNHHGTIRAENNRGGKAGATFTIRLPVPDQ
ncbi:MAG: ATP-binding protein [Candidatus Omnitrophica bacterium]|nr:ATP-binding protein [Candidatus Omnitrophota bacterium]